MTTSKMPDWQLLMVDHKCSQLMLLFPQAEVKGQSSTVHILSEDSASVHQVVSS